jgi:hypothetical protein
MTTIRPSFASENQKHALLPETSSPLGNLTNRSLKRPIVALLLRAVLPCRTTKPYNATGGPLASAQALNRVLYRGTSLLGP